jgi:hypothetical protein
MAFQYTPLDVEYCEVNDKGYCGWSCLPGTIVVQEAGGLTLEFADVRPACVDCVCRMSMP